VQLAAVEAMDIYPRCFKEIFNIFGDEREYFVLWNNTYIIMQSEIFTFWSATQTKTYNQSRHKLSKIRGLLLPLL